MSRIYLKNGNGRWFNDETAQMFKEGTYHDGHNFVSKATGLQWYHEALYRTKGGNYILCSYSDYQGTTESYEEVSREYAARWFVKNNYDDGDFPDELKSIIQEFELQ